MPGARGEGNRVRPFGNLGRLVEEFERTLRARHRLLHDCDLAADRLERGVQLGEVPDHEQELTQRQRTGLDLLRADEQHRRGAERGGRVHEEPEETLGDREPGTGAGAPPGFIEESSVLDVFASERLDDAQGGQHLLHDVKRAALDALQVLVTGPHTRRVVGAEEVERRQDHQRERDTAAN